MAGVEIFLNSLQSLQTIGPDCRRSVRYYVKFVIHRVKKELFALQVQHFTCNSILLQATVTGHDQKKNTSFKQIRDFCHRIYFEILLLIKSRMN